MKKLVLFLAFVLVTKILFAQWQWQNPYPQPHGLIDIFFINENVGWTTCNNDTILKTLNGGQSWEMISYSPDKVLWRIRFFDLQLGIAIADDGIILKSNDGGENWDMVPGVTSQHLHDLCIVTSGKGWIVGDSGVILKTDDYGDTWAEQSNGIGQVEIFENICFVNENDGWARGIENDTPCLYRTQDGGNTWSSQDINIPNPECLKDIFFIDSMIGWWVWKGDVGGTITGWIYQTNDGGENWELIFEMVEGNYIKDILFTDSLNGWITTDYDYAGYYISPIMHTNDGGCSWEAQYFNFPHDISPSKIYFLDNYHGWAASGPHFSHTSDGGLTWESQSGAQTYFYLRDICIIDENNIRALGNNFMYYPPFPCILRTDNGGANGSWTHSYYDGSWFLKSLCYTDINNGWAAGENLLVHTTDGGNNWEEISTWWLPSTCINEIQFLDALNGWIVGYKDWNPVGGIIVHTSDGGGQWEVQLDGAENDFNNFYFNDASNGWVVGDNGDIRITYDGGSSWGNQTSSTNKNLNEIFFTDSQNGWIVGDSGTIIHTSDGGNSWELQNSGTEIDLRSICFLDQYNGWVVGSVDMFPFPFFSGGIILYTNDGGLTWINKTEGMGCGQSKVAFLDHNNGWMIGGGGSILYSDEGIITEISEPTFPKTKDHLIIYPNPSKEKIIISYELSDKEKAGITIYNTNGQVVEQIILGQTIQVHYELDCRDFIPGIYLITLKTDSRILTEKLIIK